MTGSEVQARSRWPRRVFTLALVAAAIVVPWLTRNRWLPAAGRFLDVGGAPTRTDLVLVLPGDAATRPFVAAELFKAGLAQRVLVETTETGPAEARGILPANNVLEREILIARGVPADKIETLSGQSASTWDDALVIAEYLQQHDDQTLTIVTSDFHTRRTRWTFVRVLGEKADRVHIVSAPCDRHRADNWWLRREGVAIYVSEYLKMVFYAAHYGGPWDRMILLGVAIGILVLMALLKPDSRAA